MEVAGVVQWAVAAAAAFAAASRLWAMAVLPSGEAPEPLWMQEDDVNPKP